MTHQPSSDASTPDHPETTAVPDASGDVSLLTTADVRQLLGLTGVRPTKALGQNFVTDPGTVRRIVRLAGVTAGDVVVEVGPGLGSLTLGLLEAGAHVVAVEIDPVLAERLPATIAAKAPGLTDHLTVVRADALAVTELPAPGGVAPSRLVANLPYNVAVPVLLTMLERFDSIAETLVMVQTEVADRIAAPPGSKVYGIPSAKAAWYSEARTAGSVSRSIFWPTPNVDSSLVRLVRRDPPAGAERGATFAVVDAAFAQRRKTLRAALAGWAGSPVRAEELLRAAGIDPVRRGETLSITEFAAIAAASA